MSPGRVAGAAWRHCSSGRFRSALVVAAIGCLSSTGCRPDEPSTSRPTRDGKTARDEVDASADLEESRRRGKVVYATGFGRGGRAITARIGASREDVSAAILTCSNCHGRDGRGRPEGGLDPSDLTWAALGRASATDGRRSRPAYDAALLARAITTGLDAGGSPLGVGMPRYRVAAEDMGDLVAYIQALGLELDPGVTAESVRLGVLLPADGLAPDYRATMVDTIEAYVRDWNARGGVYQRSVTLAYDEMPPSPDEAAGRLASFVDGQGVFALVAPYIAGHEEAVIRASTREGIPVIGPIGRETPDDPTAHAPIFWTQPGQAAQARALAAFAMRSPASIAPVVVREEGATSAHAAEATARAWSSGGVEPERYVLGPGATAADLDSLAARLASRAGDVVVYLGPPALARPLIDAAERASWRPRFFVPIASAQGLLDDLPAAFAGRVIAAFPAILDDVTKGGREFLDRLHDEQGLGRGRLATRVSILTSLRVAEEGIRRAGRELSRVRLVEELDRLDAFETGLSRPLSFAPGRRSGARGAYLMTIGSGGREFEPLGWQDAE